MINFVYFEKRMSAVHQLALCTLFVHQFQFVGSVFQLVYILCFHASCGQPVLYYFAGIFPMHNFNFTS